MYPKEIKEFLLDLPEFCRYMDVSENSGTPKSSILIGFSIINHSFWGIPIFGNTHIYIYISFRGFLVCMLNFSWCIIGLLNPCDFWGGNSKAGTLGAETSRRFRVGVLPKYTYPKVKIDGLPIPKKVG